MNIYDKPIIVPTSVNPDELCVNGMSFSQRQSPFANAALVVTVSPEDLGYISDNNNLDQDPMLGVLWQQEIEQKAARMGGGSLVAPVQRVTDFLAEVATPTHGGDVSVSFDSSSSTPLKGRTGRTGFTSTNSMANGGIPSSYRLGVIG